MADLKNNKEKRRWWIEACFTTVSPLHVGGDGFFKQLSTKEELTEINGVVTDCDGRAYIPGSTIKGNMRAWLQKNIAVGDDIEKNLFGEDSVENDSGRGGKAEFWDARIITPFEPHFHIPHWNPRRQTGIELSAVINRSDGTAAQSLLHTLEYVPSGVTFRLIITGNGFTPEEIACLLTILESCKDAAKNNAGTPKPLRFGSGSSNNYGQMECNISCVRATSKESVDKWLAADCPGSWTDCLEPLDDTLAKEIETARNGLTILGEDRIRITLKLSFSGPFLINDPTREVMVKDADDKARKLDHVPLLDGQGKICLPPKSFRGALRSQAEKILRTMGCRCCRPDIAEERCPAIYRNEDADTLLCPVCQIFGAGGWGAPLVIEKISLNNIPATVVRQFVAIDRFTGGTASGAKFDAKVAMEPEFIITLSLDYGRLANRSIALLAMLWRDLYEGDIRFGMDKGIGFGVCRATVESIENPSETSGLEPTGHNIQKVYKNIRTIIMEDQKRGVVSKVLREIVESSMERLNIPPDAAAVMEEKV